MKPEVDEAITEEPEVADNTIQEPEVTEEKLTIYNIKGACLKTNIKNLKSGINLNRRSKSLRKKSMKSKPN